MTNMLNEVLEYAIRKHKIGQLSAEERGRIYDTYAEILIMSKTARSYGLLLLEEAAMSLTEEIVYSSLLKCGLMLVCDGTAPELTEEILITRYWADEKNEAESLVGYAIIRSVLMIQDGMNPYIIEEFLLATISKEYREKCKMWMRARLDEYETKKKETSVKTYHEIDYKVLDEEVSRLANKLRLRLYNMSNSSIQQLLFRIDNDALSDAMIALTSEARDILFKNMSSQLATDLMSDISFKVRMIDGKYVADEDAIKCSLEEILYLIEHLGEAGGFFTDEEIAILLGELMDDDE